MNATELKAGIIVRGPVLPEPIEVLVVTPLGDVIKIVGAGQKTGPGVERAGAKDMCRSETADTRAAGTFKNRRAQNGSARVTRGADAYFFSARSMSSSFWISRWTAWV